MSKQGTGGTDVVVHPHKTCVVVEFKREELTVASYELDPVMAKELGEALFKVGCQVQAAGIASLKKE
jgi:hypothetical protein